MISAQIASDHKAHSSTSEIMGLSISLTLGLLACAVPLTFDEKCHQNSLKFGQYLIFFLIKFTKLRFQQFLHQSSSSSSPPSHLKLMTSKMGSLDFCIFPNGFIGSFRVP